MRILFIFFLTLSGNLLWAQDTVIIAGNIQDLNGHLITLSYKKGDKKNYERVTPDNGKFEVRINVSEPIEIEISPYHYAESSIQDKVNKFYYANPPLEVFAVPGDSLFIEGEALNIWNAMVKGGNHAQEYNQLRALVGPLVNKGHNLRMEEYKKIKAGDTLGIGKMESERLKLPFEKSALIKRFYLEHTNSFYALFKFFENINSLQPDEPAGIFATYSPELRQSDLGQHIQHYIDRIKTVGKGKPMIDFNGRTLNGKEFDTKNLRSKYLLLDFWGSWCKPCRKSNPHLKELYARYKDNGFEIVGIGYEITSSIEKGRLSLSKAVREDGLPWPQLLNNELPGALDVVKAYNVGVFPTKILIDTNGMIIWRGVGSQESGLDKVLTSIFGK